MPSPAKRTTGELFAEAVELGREERDAWLEALRVASPERAGEIASLLSAHDAAASDGFLDAGGGGPLFGRPPEPTEPPSSETDARLAETAWMSTELRRDVPAVGPQGGVLVAGDYELLDQIGRGGMGVVYRAKQLSLNRHVALKIIPGRLATSEEQVARFYLEAEAAGRLDHPGIVPVLGVGAEENVHYYAMALVEGGSLARFVGGRERVTPTRAAQLIQRAAVAVQHAHDRAVIHRDIKPANVLLDGDGAPRLTDFGLAKLGEAGDQLTATGAVMGTPSYMAPEQAEGRSTGVSTRADVYSLGATLYALLAGNPPFSGKTALDTIDRVRNATPRPLPAETPSDLRVICQKCLAKAPGDRYASASALAADLQAYLHGFPIAARPVGPIRRAVAWSRRNPAYAAMAAAIVVSLLAGAAISTAFGIEATRQAARAQRNAQTLGDAIEENFLFASDTLSESPGMQAVRERLLRSAEGYYQRMIDGGDASPETLADARFRLGRVLRGLGRLDEAQESLRDSVTALQTIEETSGNESVRLAALADAHNELARVAKRRVDLRPSGTPPDAATVTSWIEASETTRSLRARVAERLPNSHEAERRLANAEMNLGIALLAADGPSAGDDASQWIESAQRRRRRLLERSPADTRVLSDLAAGLVTQSDLVLEEAGAELTELADTRVAKTLLSLCREAVATLERAPAADRTAEDDWRLAVCHQRVGECHSALDQPADAAVAFERTRTHMRRLARRHPAVGAYQLGLADACFNVAVSRLAASDPSGYAAFESAAETLLEAYEIDPSHNAAVATLLAQTERFAEGIAAAGLTRVAEGVIAGVERRVADSLEAWSGGPAGAERLRETAAELSALKRRVAPPADRRTL
ncbi:MAG: serine/threonine-protein kinase [Planctomycetota bacterium]